MENMKECPQGGLGEVLSRQEGASRANARGQESVCVQGRQEAAGAEGKGIVMRSHVRPDPVGLRMLEVI